MRAISSAIIAFEFVTNSADAPVAPRGKSVVLEGVERARVKGERGWPVFGRPIGSLTMRRVSESPLCKCWVNFIVFFFPVPLSSGNVATTVHFPSRCLFFELWSRQR